MIYAICNPTAGNGRGRKIGQEIEKRLLEQHFKVATMPTLRTVTQSCGISLRLAAEDYEPARKMVAESGLSPQMYAIYLVDSNKNVLELSK